MEKINEKLKQLTKDDLMRTERFTPDYKEIGFNEDDIANLIEIGLDTDLKFTNSEDEKELFFPCHAIQVLGQLGVLEPFDEFLKRLDDFIDDDYYRSAVLYYLRKVGQKKIKELIAYFLNPDNNIYNRMLILEALESFIEENGLLNQELEDAFTEYLRRDSEFDDGLNAMAIFALINISGAKHIDLIREVFETKPVDIFYAGDLEDIEMRVGLREKRSNPREKNIFQKLMEMDNNVPIISEPKIGRNDPCPCGSGKKYKKCCLNK